MVWILINYSIILEVFQTCKIMMLNSKITELLSMAKTPTESFTVPRINTTKL